MKLLIVDDSKVIRERLMSMLRDVQTIESVTEAENYHTAMEALATFNPDTVILDINMDGKNGLDILLELKSLLNPPVVIMMSNYSDIYYRDLCKKMGADYFFDKSTEFEKIPDVLNSFVQL